MISSQNMLPDKPRFSVIVPAHNEEKRIFGTLNDFARIFADSEIIVVLNGCVDGTKAVVEDVRREHSNVHLVDIPDAVGKGGAVRAGFLLARADVIGYVDADGSTSALEMRRLFESLGDFDGCIGSRWMPGSDVAVKQPVMRRIASRCFNTLVRVFFGLRYSDTQCGAKVFRRAALQKVVADLETSNMAFDVDLLFHMKMLNMRVKEEPTTWIDSEGSQVRLLSASSRMFAGLIRMRLRRSLLRLAVPFFDRCFPTKPLRVHDRFRILIINWRDPRHPQAGGAEAYLFEQAKLWVSWGHHVEWLTAGFKGGSPYDEIEGIKIRRVGNAFSVYALVPFVYLREFRHRFDVILDSSNGIPFFTPLFSMKPRICVIYHIHQEVFRNHLPFWLAAPLMWCEAKLVPLLYKRSRFVTISDDTRQGMIEMGVDDHHLGLVRCGVDPSLVPGRKSTSPMLVCLGRLKAYKRVDHVIRAFADVKKAVPDARLHVAGTGDARETLERLTARLGLADSVVFEGFVDDARKLSLLQEAWVTVSASETEGWGISVIESNACATPTVAYDVPGLGEAIVDGYNGSLVSEGESLAPAIIEILTNVTKRSQLEATSLERAREFSWTSAASQMLAEFLHAIVGSRIQSVDLNEDWALVGTAVAKSAKSSFVLSNRSMFRETAAVGQSSSSARTEAVSPDGIRTN